MAWGKVRRQALPRGVWVIKLWRLLPRDGAATDPVELSNFLWQIIKLKRTFLG